MICLIKYDLFGIQDAMDTSFLQPCKQLATQLNRHNWVFGDPNTCFILGNRLSGYKDINFPEQRNHIICYREAFIICLVG